MGRRRHIGVAAAAFLAAFVPARSVAEDWTTTIIAPPKTYYYEAWGGADGTGRAVSVYGGMTTALFGDIRADGFRLRSTAGYGLYEYSRSYSLGNRRAWQDFRGTMTTTDVMIGYQRAFGPWIVKIFAGGTEETHAVVAHGGSGLAFDTRNSVQGTRFGFKGALETWLNIDNVAFLQTDLSWSQPFEAYSSRIRAGYRISPALSAGLEAGVHGNANHDAGRLGSFLRFEWTGGEISASAGLAATTHEVTGAYGSIGLMFRF